MVIYYYELRRLVFFYITFSDSYSMPSLEYFFSEYSDSSIYCIHHSIGHYPSISLLEWSLPTIPFANFCSACPVRSGRVVSVPYATMAVIIQVPYDWPAGK